MWLFTERGTVMIDRVIVAVTLLLFMYCVLSWRGLIGGEAPWRPLQTVIFTGAVFLQATAALVLRRSRPVGWALLLASLVAMGVSLTVDG